MSIQQAAAVTAVIAGLAAAGLAHDGKDPKGAAIAAGVAGMIASAGKDAQPTEGESTDNETEK